MCPTKICPFSKVLCIYNIHNSMYFSLIFISLDRLQIPIRAGAMSDTLINKCWLGKYIYIFKCFQLRLQNASKHLKKIIRKKKKKKKKKKNWSQGEFLSTFLFLQTVKEEWAWQNSDIDILHHWDAWWLVLCRSWRMSHRGWGHCSKCFPGWKCETCATTLPGGFFITEPPTGKQKNTGRRSNPKPLQG